MARGCKTNLLLYGPKIYKYCRLAYVRKVPLEKLSLEDSAAAAVDHAGATLMEPELLLTREERM